MLFIVYYEVFGNGLGFTYGSKFSNGYGVYSWFRKFMGLVIVFEFI